MHSALFYSCYSLYHIHKMDLNIRYSREVVCNQQQNCLSLIYWPTVAIQLIAENPMPPNLNSVHFKDFFLLFLSNCLNIIHNEVQRSNLLTPVLLDTVDSKMHKQDTFPLSSIQEKREELIQEAFKGNPKTLQFHPTWKRNCSINLTC